MPSGTIAVALSVGSELELRGLSHQLEAAGVPHTLIVEGEGKYAGQAMAIGCEPTTNRSAIRKVTSHLPCVKGRTGVLIRED